MLASCNNSSKRWQVRVTRIAAACTGSTGSHRAAFSRVRYETEQDAILLEVEKGVGNLHQYSKAIGEEATLHNVSLSVFA